MTSAALTTPSKTRYPHSAASTHKPASAQNTTSAPAPTVATVATARANPRQKRSTTPPNTKADQADNPVGSRDLAPASQARMFPASCPGPGDV